MNSQTDTHSVSREQSESSLRASAGLRSERSERSESSLRAPAGLRSERSESSLRAPAGFRREFIGGDRGIWVIIILLSLISLAAIYSSTNSLAILRGKSAYFFLFKQLGFVTLGLATLFVCHLIPLGWYRIFAFFGMIAGIILLIFTLMRGVTDNEATRAIPIFGFSIQSSELVKVVMVLYIAKVIEDRKYETFRDFTIYLIIPIAILMLLLLWGSVSAALLLAGTALIILFIAGISFKFLFRMVGIYFAGLVLIVALALPISHIFPSSNFFPRKDTAKARVLSWVGKGGKEDSEKKRDTYQADQAKIAIASGGLLGRGPGNSTQRYVLPKAYHDFIYAIIVEEYGIWGGGAVLILFLWFFFRCYLIAKRCTRPFSSLLVIGLGLLIVLQAMLHISVNVGLLPVTGQPLPLISKGGTSFVAVSIAFGMILAVSRTLEKTEIKEIGGEMR